jgi:outer membrane protein OmpA-like peptidoglycan-associated protein
MSRTKATLGAAAILGAVLVPMTAHAQATRPGFAVNKFEPSERGSDWFANESLDYRGNFRPAVGVVGDYSYRSLIVFEEDGDVRGSVVRNAFFVHPGASLVLFERLRLAFNLPVQAAVDGHAATLVRDGVNTTFLPPPDNGGLGDLRFGADARLFGVYGDPITMAAGVQFWAPTGSEKQYAGDGDWRIKPRVMLAGDISAFTYAGQLAVNWRARDEKIGAGAIGSEFNATLAAGARLADKKLVVGPELWASTVFDDAFGKKTTPIETALGAHYLIADQIRVGAGVSTGLTRSFGAPVFRGVLSVEWAPGVAVDRDGDGIDDGEDACPDTRGVRSADPAKNGCPPPEPPPPAPSDRDHDDIPDASDACPDTPGVKTDDPATSGCRDTDGDGVYDPKDACPTERGIASSDSTLNGCPDSDGDGVFDKVDACPNEPGRPDPDPKKNGCPVDLDRDKDGINNDVDACPDDPGKPDPDPKKNGCPKAFISADQIKILDQVKFKVGSAAIDTGKESLEVLLAVEKVLREHPEIRRVRIEGHTDKTGSAQVNKKLSAERAMSVMKWFVGAGIAKDRLTSVGFGPDRPIDTNQTEDGRKNNRRVEFHIE